MIPEEIKNRLSRIEQAVGLMPGIIDITPERTIEKVQASFVGPRPPEMPEEEERFDPSELLRKVEGMISDALGNRFDDLPSDVYEIIGEYNSNPSNITQVFRNVIQQQGIKVKIFEVQSEATGDGVYNCYEQTLDATEWDDTAGDDKFDDKNSTSVEVLNLFENNPESEYIASLATGERIAAWQWVDDEGVKRWVGIPVEARRKTNIFQVQSVTEVDGVYLCLKRTLTGWGTTEYEVLNLIENDTIEAYTPMLAFEDRIAGWEMRDEGGTKRWVGTPTTPSVRMAKTTEAAPAATNLTCNLIGNDGESEITSGLGSGIEVYCRITMAANLNAALPRLKDDDFIFVQNISGKWWCVAPFQGSENCVCSGA